MNAAQKVYLASGNAHKLCEFQELVKFHRISIDLRGAGEAGGMPDVDESGSTFAENAFIKARALMEIVDNSAWVLSDDSGLVVDALHGSPGVHSARFAGPGAKAAANNLKLLHELKGVPEDKRTARFVCVLCLLRGDQPVKYFTGKCEGHIMVVPSGDEGFGYDPLFTPSGFDKTFASLGNETKHRLSHRGKAVEALCQFLLAQEFNGT